MYYIFMRIQRNVNLGRGNVNLGILARINHISLKLSLNPNW